jgi:hypothetical protein
MHWTKRKEIKDSILSITKGFCRPIQKVQSYPIQISYRFVFSSRSLDTLNTAVMAKMFEDSLHSLRIIQDDSPKFVGESILTVIECKSKKDNKTAHVKSSKLDKENEDYVEIEIKNLI